MSRICPKCQSNDTTLIQNHYTDSHDNECWEFYLNCLTCGYDEAADK